jgi:hypothetical protein
MQGLIVSGKLPCTKDECATLAAIQLRIYEISYMKSMEDEKTETSEEQPLNVKSSKNKSYVVTPINETTPLNSQNEDLSKLAETENKTEDLLDIKLLNTPTDKSNEFNLIKEQDELNLKCDDNESTRLNDRKESLVVSEFVMNDSNLNMPVLTNGGCESVFFYLKSCSCLSTHGSSRILSIKQLVPASYHNSNDMMKLIKVII